MSCYKVGGCGEYEGLNCDECPASNPNYVNNVKVVIEESPNSNRNELFELLNSPLLKTDNVNRYSGLYQSNPELLSVHVVDVQFLSLMIARKLQSLGEKVNIGVLLEKGLVHDVDETLTGDFTRLVKYSSTTCHDALEAVAESVVQEISNNMDGTQYLFDVWDHAKDDTIEGYIIKICDMLSVIKKVSKEIDQLNNYSFLRVALEVRSYINDLYSTVPIDLFFMPDSISYIKNLLISTSKYLAKIVSAHKDIIDRLDIDNTTVKYIVNNRYNKPGQE